MVFYRKLRKEPEASGFILVNPCVANMATKSGKLMWNVDNMMGSCDVDFELMRFSCYLANIYGPKLTMHTRQKHDNLRVDMEFKDSISIFDDYVPQERDIRIPREDCRESSHTGL